MPKMGSFRKSRPAPGDIVPGAGPFLLPKMALFVNPGRHRRPPFAIASFQPRIECFGDLY